MIFRHPIFCNYFVTLRCNDTCEFCGIWQNEEFKTIKEAPLDTVVRNLRDLKKLGVRYVDFTGGEPLLRADIPQILRASKELGLHNILTTNGILFQDRIYEIASCVDTLLLSLDSPFEDEHDRIRGTACYDQLVKGIKAARRAFDKVLVNFTLTRESVLFLPEMVDMAQKMNVLLWINPVYKQGGIEGFEDESLAYIARYKDRKNVAFNFAGLDLIKQGGNRLNRPVCRAVDSVITILPDDRIVFPCFYKMDFSATISGKLRSLYQEKRKIHRRRQGRFEECSGCFAWPYMNPSFFYRFDKKFLMAAYSLVQLILKQNKFRRERVI